MEEAARLLLHSGAALLQAAALRTDRDAPLRRDMTGTISKLTGCYRNLFVLTSELELLLIVG